MDATTLKIGRYEMKPAPRGPSDPPGTTIPKGDGLVTATAQFIDRTSMPGFVSQHFRQHECVTRAASAAVLLALGGDPAKALEMSVPLPPQGLAAAVLELLADVAELKAQCPAGGDSSAFHDALAELRSNARNDHEVLEAVVRGIARLEERGTLEGLTAVLDARPTDDGSRALRVEWEATTAAVALLREQVVTLRTELDAAKLQIKAAQSAASKALAKNGKAES